jgi:type IV pilus assembly protein PilB
MAPQLKKRFINKRIGELLIDSGAIDLIHLETALRIQREQQHNGHLSSGDILIQLGYAREEQIIEAFLRQYSVPYLPLNSYNINPHAIEIVPQELAQRLQIMPIDIMGNNLTIAVANPFKHQALDELHSITGLHIMPCIARSQDIANSIALHYGLIEPYNWEDKHVSGN